MKFGGIELEGRLGGLEIINQSATKLPQDLASGFAKINSEILGATYMPIWLVGKQIVNGTNYYLVCKQIRSTREKATGIVCLVINIPLSRVPNGDGARIVEIIESYELPAEVQDAFDKTVRALVGVGYTPLVYLGKQVVHGIRYYVLCEANPMTLAGEPYAAITSFTVVDGEAVLSTIEEIK